jgi:hypothetical protein
MDINHHRGMTGVVTELCPGYDIEEHGAITVRLDPHCVGKFPCSPPDEEHYVHYRWWEFLKVID